MCMSFNPHPTRTPGATAYRGVSETDVLVVSTLTRRERRVRLTGAFLRGAFVAELILNKTGKEMLDIATPDPASMRFKQRNDPDYGTTWELGQWQFGKWVSLEKYDTIRYMPIDPLPGSPYGRAIAAPALFTTIFLLGLMHDLRRSLSKVRSIADTPAWFNR